MRAMSCAVLCCTAWQQLLSPTQRHGTKSPCRTGCTPNKASSAQHGTGARPWTLFSPTLHNSGRAPTWTWPTALGTADRRHTIVWCTAEDRKKNLQSGSIQGWYSGSLNTTAQKAIRAGCMCVQGGAGWARDFCWAG